MSQALGDVAGPGIVLNLAGEGETPDAIDVNTLQFPLLQPERWVRPGRFIQADVTALPVRDDAVTEAVGRKLPMMSDGDRASLVHEAARVLIPGGVLRLHASSGGATIWLPFLEAAALGTGSIVGIYAVGVKPR